MSVPQRSVLGPLIYINGVTQIPLNNGTHPLLYADDILIYRRIQTQMDYHLLQRDVGALETWLLQNHLQLNASKCKYMTISRKRSLYHPIINSALKTNPLKKYPLLSI